MTRAELITTANEAREIIALLHALPESSVTRKALALRAERIAQRCELTLASQVSGHAPVVELFGGEP